jgi:hypothetical protein
LPRKDLEELEVLSVTSPTQWQQAIAECAKREEALWDIAFAMSEVADSYRTTADAEVRTAITGELSKRLSKNSKLICDIWRAAASPWTKRRSDLPHQDPALD